MSCNFLRYKSLCSAIPKQWKDLLNNDFSVTDLLDDASIIKDLNSETKLSKLFYVKFLNVKLDKLTANQRSPSALAKWQSSDWFDQNLSGEDIFLTPFQATKSTKLLEFQYFILHRTLYTNSRLFKMQIVPSERCTFLFYLYRIDRSSFILL